MSDSSTSPPRGPAQKEDQRLLIGVVGPCGSGKSTLILGLEKHGYRCRHIAQEHSYVKTMWQKITDPDTECRTHSSDLMPRRLERHG